MCVFLGAAAAGAGAAASASAGIGTAITIMSTIASTGFGIMQAMAAQQSANAQYQAQMEHRKQMEIQAQKTLNLQVAQQQTAFESEKGKAQGEKADLAIAAYEAKSRATASAAESGIVGISLGHVLGNIDNKLTGGEGKIDYNSKVAYYNTQNELKMAQRGAGARLAEIPIPVKPSFAPTALAIGSSLIKGATGVAQAYYGDNQKWVPGYQNANGQMM